MNAHENKMRVSAWEAGSRAVTGSDRVGSGALSVADPRIDGHHKSVQMGVRGWDEPTGVIKGDMSAGCGPYTIADPRIDGVKHNNCFRIVRWGDVSNAITGGTGPTAGGLNVADPRGPGAPDALHGKYHITPFCEASRAVISGRDNGGCYVADPRAPQEWAGGGKYRVNSLGEPVGTVIAESGTGNGAFAVADPRPPNCPPLKAEGRDYQSSGSYGVVPWSTHSGAVSAQGQHDNSPSSVADPRLPAPSDRLVCVIRSQDNTWHRPFTTLELAALQSLIDPEEKLELDGLSDSAWRERIGNAVPPHAAAAVAGVIGTTLLLAWTGETFVLGSTPIWVRDIEIALSVAQRVVS